MKRLLFVFLFFVTSLSFAQQNYTINGETLSLYSEAEGNLTLLWNSFDNNYRYFIKDGNEIEELKNTKANGTYQEEYKAVLQKHTGMDVSKVRFTKPDLVKVIDSYNIQNDATYTSEATSAQLKARLGGFAGITNAPYLINLDISTHLQLGAELEVIDEVKLKRHSLALQFRQIFANGDYDISSSQFSLNYRFKFVKCDHFDVYVNTKIAQYSNVSSGIEFTDENDEVVNLKGSGGDFQAPFAFGLGADIALGNGYVTLLYQDIYAINLNKNDEFPLDFAIGYKWKL
ncbi:MAG: hypothetical protein R2786_10220 [Flavobacteriaceae bacterium]